MVTYQNTHGWNDCFSFRVEWYIIKFIKQCYICTEVAYCLRQYFVLSARRTIVHEVSFHILVLSKCKVQYILNAYEYVTTAK